MKIEKYVIGVNESVIRESRFLLGGGLIFRIVKKYDLLSQYWIRG
ncbi:MAG: hypothetical protein E7L10_06085 [Clostridium sp.]|nr:hypothetical protein [Clostridium sp.]